MPINPAVSQPVQPRAHLIEDFLPCGQLVHVLGEHGTGKSLISASIAFHVAAPLPWRSRDASGKGVVFTAPSDAGVTMRRFHALAEHHEIELPADLYFTDDDPRDDPKAFAADLAQINDLGLVVLDLGHLGCPNWLELTLLAQLCRKSTGASIILLQEGSIRTQELTPGWDVLWRMSRTINELVLLQVEHMRDSATVGRLAFHVSPQSDAAVLVGTGARPVPRPRLTTTLDIIFDALMMSAGEWNGYTLDEGEFAELVRSLDFDALRDKTPKHANEQIGRWRDQLVKHKLISWHDRTVTVRPAWRHVRRLLDLDPTTDGPAEDLAKSMGGK